MTIWNHRRLLSPIAIADGCCDPAPSSCRGGRRISRCPSDTGVIRIPCRIPRTAVKNTSFHSPMRLIHDQSLGWSNVCAKTPASVLNNIWVKFLGNLHSFRVRVSVWPIPSPSLDGILVHQSEKLRWWVHFWAWMMVPQNLPACIVWISESCWHLWRAVELELSSSAHSFWKRHLPAIFGFFLQYSKCSVLTTSRRGPTGSQQQNHIFNRIHRTTFSAVICSSQNKHYVSI